MTQNGNGQLEPAKREIATTDRGTKLPDYSEGDVDYALTLLIENEGNKAATIEQLEDAGISVTKTQLTEWPRRQFRDRYFAIRADHTPRIEEDLAGRALERASQADTAHKRVLELAIEKADEIPPKDLPRAAQALAQSKAIDIEKSRLLRDRPTEIRETRSVEELVAVLRRLDVLKIEA